MTALAHLLGSREAAQMVAHPMPQRRVLAALAAFPAAALVAAGLQSQAAPQAQAAQEGRAS
jgi:hypothetical protein